MENKNLYQKLYKIMNETEALKKDLSVGEGKNSYKAIGEKAVLNEIKPLLKKHGVILFPIKIEATERVNTYTSTKEDYKTRERYQAESSRLMTQIIATYKIVDVDSGEYELLQTIGNGVDTQDKASGKAMTYAYKVLLQKTFMLFSGEDTDNQHSDEITEGQTTPRKPVQPKQNVAKPESLVSEKQIVRLFAIANENGVSKDSIKADLHHLGKESTKELTVSEYDKLIESYERSVTK